MTAPTPTRTDVAALDEHITRALVDLRLARAAAARADTPRNRDAEARTEANLNKLLEYRYSTGRRSSS